MLLSASGGRAYHDRVLAERRDQGRHFSSHLTQRGKLLVDLREPLAGKGQHLLAGRGAGARLTPARSEHLMRLEYDLHILEREAHFLADTDHPHPFQVRNGVGAVAGCGTRGWCEQPLALVEADGLDVHARALGELPDAQKLWTGDSHRRGLG